MYICTLYVRVACIVPRTYRALTNCYAAPGSFGLTTATTTTPKKSTLTPSTKRNSSPPPPALAKRTTGAKARRHTICSVISKSKLMDDVVGPGHNKGRQWPKGRYLENSVARINRSARPTESLGRSIGLNSGFLIGIVWQSGPLP